MNSNFSTEKNSYCVEKVEHPKIATSTAKTMPVLTEEKKPLTKEQLPTEKTTSTTPKAPVTEIQPTLGPVAQTTTSANSEQSEVKVAAVEIPHHHILGGIFLPIFIVLGFIAGVFVVKKYDLLDRAHRFIRNRDQNQYNGLMEADFDDDACLI